MHILSEQSYAFFYPSKSIKYYMGNDLPCSYTVHCPRQHLNSRPFISARRGQSCFLCYSFSNILVPVTGVFNLLLTLLFRSNFCPILLVEQWTCTLWWAGVNDVTWNNPRAETHVLDSLARRGVILDNFYTLPICTPSRAALLTGIYPFRYGLQVYKTTFHTFIVIKIFLKIIFCLE